jgi:hypothetical protein
VLWFSRNKRSLGTDHPRTAKDAASPSAVWLNSNPCLHGLNLAGTLPTSYTTSWAYISAQTFSEAIICRDRTRKNLR